MAFTFAPAVREQVSLLIALAGPSGSGKTKSALLLAEGMSPDGKIFFVDTEARRGLHYADQHRFQHADMRPLFRPERFVEAIQAAEQAGAEVVIIDSFSHEYDGEGGILDWAAEIEAGGTKAPGNWKVPKLKHKKLMNALLQCRCSIIFCLRADEKIEIGRDANGKTQIRPLGWQPICEKRFMFEMTASFTLVADKPGVPRFDLPHKLQEQHRAMFPADRQMGREAGAALAAWARGGAPVSPAPAADDLADLIARGDTAAREGGSELHAFWTGLSGAQRKALGKARLDEWKVTAMQDDDVPADDAELTEIARRADEARGAGG